jgi:Secretion system C-terminal sorting domain
MKHFTLVLCLNVSAFGTALGQCTPNPLYADSVFGIWPTPDQGFADGVVNVPYNQTVDFKIPEDGGAIDPALSFVDVDSMQLATVVGLPPGLQVQCNSQTPAECTFLPNSGACALITGTPTQAGTFPLEVTIVAYNTIFGITTPFPFPNSDYSIVITDPTGVAELQVRSASSSVLPNPVSDLGEVQFTLPRAGSASVAIFDLTGKQVWGKRLAAKAGQNKVGFDARNHPSGLYLYKVQCASTTLTGRLVID